MIGKGAIKKLQRITKFFFSRTVFNIYFYIDEHKFMHKHKVGSRILVKRTKIVDACIHKHTAGY